MTRENDCPGRCGPRAAAPARPPGSARPRTAAAAGPAYRPDRGPGPARRYGNRTPPPRRPPPRRPRPPSPSGSPGPRSPADSGPRAEDRASGRGARPDLPAVPETARKNRSSLGVLSAATLPSSSTASSRATTHTYHSSGPHCPTMVPGSHGHRSRSPCSSRFERGYRTSTGLSSGNLPSLSSSCMTWLHFRSQADNVCHYR